MFVIAKAGAASAKKGAAHSTSQPFKILIGAFTIGIPSLKNALTLLYSSRLGVSQHLLFRPSYPVFQPKL
jgi:hypothetical protein